MSTHMQIQAKGTVQSPCIAATGLLQRKCACGEHTVAGGECEGCRQKRENTLQRAAINAMPTASNGVPPIVHEVLGLQGRQVDAGARAVMEPRFGHDFSQVRVHTDSRAAESARAVNALAYTVGRNVVFGTGQYAPGTGEGRKLLAHELTHVVQQGTHPKTLRRNLVTDPVDSPLEQEASSVANTLGRAGLKPIQGHGCIQCQSAPVGTSIHTPWDDLPANTQQAIKKAYFNSLDAERQNAFRAVYNALVTESLWGEAIEVVDVFPINVRGIKATGKNSLTGRIFSHPHFCRDTRLGGSQHKGAATWRQVVQAGTEGLHISVFGPNFMEAHLDTISPVAGREPNGECRYSMQHVLPHISRDLKGLRNLEILPGPTSEPRSGDIQPLISISIPGT